jgi:hypothetical protein
MASYCPSCGAAVKPSTVFCPNCGANVNQPSAPVQQPQYTPPPQPVYAPVAPPKKSKNLLIIAVIAVVAIVIIAIAAIALAGNNSGSSNDNNDNNSNGTNSNDQLAMTVSSVKGYHSTSMISQPVAGNYLVIAYANITNKGVMTMVISPIYMKMVGSNDVEYSYSYDVDTFMPDSLASDRTMAIYCGFELPKGVTPKTLKYDDSTDKISVTIPSSVMDLTVPEFVKITLVGATNPATGPYPADAGNKYVTVTVEFTNLQSTEVTLNPLYFTLKTADGLTHDTDFAISPTVPDGLQGGANATMSVSYQVASGTTLTELVYDDYVSVITVAL